MFAARAFGLLLSLACLTIPAATAAGSEIHAPLPLDAGKLRAAKGAAARRYQEAQPGQRAAPSRGTRAAAIFGSLNKPGLGDPTINTQTPSDSTGAIGPSHYVETVNARIGVFRRSDLGLVGQQLPLDAFIKHAGDNVTPGDDVFDPQMMWDPTTQRWYYLSDDIGPDSSPVTSDGPNFLAFGWSKTADPTDLVNGWCHFRINTDQTFGGPSAAPGRFFADYPKLGDNDTQLIFGTNLFDQSSATPGTEEGGFVTGDIFTVPKPPAGDTSCPAEDFFQSTAKVAGTPAKPLKNASGQTTFTPVPANAFDGSATGYVVAAEAPLGGPQSQISSFPVDAAGSVGTPVNFTVAPYDVPGPAPQPNTPNTLDTLDGRLTQAVAHADPGAGGRKAIWTQHAVDGPGGRSVERWYELLPTTGQVRQQGSVSDPSSFAFNGAISPAGDGAHAALDYNLSGPSRLPTILARSRTGPQAAGVLGAPLTIATSDQSMNDLTSCKDAPICRWGDYAAATPDPANSLLVWGSSQVSGPLDVADPSRPQWKTSNFALDTRDTPPVARFGFSPARPLTKVLVAFDGRDSRDPDGRIVGYRWNFGGREESTSATPHHVYGRTGHYRVTLTVTDDAGETSTTSQVIAVVDRRPLVSLRVLTSRPRARRAVRFDGRRSRDSDGRVIAYRWNFGGRQTSTRSAPRHVYGRAGRYVVSLTVIDDSHSRATTRRTITVRR